MPQNIVITGASSGIGKALALRYAREKARMGLLGRSRSRLEDVADQCRKLGAEVQVAAIDVLERVTLATWLEKFDRETPVDLVVANAGMLAGATPEEPVENSELGRMIIETNVIGILNTVQPVLATMLARRRGTIALMSSIAAFDPAPEMPSYSASKAALLAYGLALRTAVRPYGIRVSVICPGYVDTSMTDQISGSTPFKLSASDAAERIYQGLERGRAVIAFPPFHAFIARVAGLLPPWMRRRRMRLTIATTSDVQNALRRAPD